MYENDHVEIAKYYHMSISQTTLINLGGTFLLLLLVNKLNKLWDI